MSAVQPEALFYALLLGVLLGAVFTALDVLRILLAPCRAVQAVLDIAFCLLAALLTFLLALAVSAGALRFFQAACEIIGFLSVYLSVTHFMRRLLPVFVRGYRRVSERLERAFFRVGKIFLRKKPSSGEPNAKKCENFRKIAKKSEKNT